jgi:hypothetical protein
MYLEVEQATVLHIVAGIETLTLPHHLRGRHVPSDSLSMITMSAQPVRGFDGSVRNPRLNGCRNHKSRCRCLIPLGHKQCRTAVYAFTDKAYLITHRMLPLHAAAGYQTRHSHPLRTSFNQPLMPGLTEMRSVLRFNNSR